MKDEELTTRIRWKKVDCGEKEEKKEPGNGYNSARSRVIKKRMQFWVVGKKLSKLKQWSAHMFYSTDLNHPWLNQVEQTNVLWKHM